MRGGYPLVADRDLPPPLRGNARSCDVFIFLPRGICGGELDTRFVIVMDYKTKGGVVSIDRDTVVDYY